MPNAEFDEPRQFGTEAARMADRAGMAEGAPLGASDARGIEHFDVLIGGAGFSGIGAASQLQTECPKKSYLILEGRSASGGTWDLFRYPGGRSDSDMYTLGYRFRPWREAKAIADGPSILRYIRETAHEYEIDRKIRYGHQVKLARWSSADAEWAVEAAKADGSVSRFTCNFLYMCSGYYDYAGGYMPGWPAMEKFRGRIVHPQKWPEDLEYKDKRVVVIGSGATSVTLVPAMAAVAAHVYMLQRSPTYFFPGRNRNRLADTLRELDIDEMWIHEIVRRKIVFDQRLFVHRALNEPDAAKQDLLAGVAAYLPEDDVARHFTPTYKPWRQRIAYVPDGDLFESLRSGKASVVTDHIDRFTTKGIRLKSGQELEADIVVTATG